MENTSDPLTLFLVLLALSLPVFFVFLGANSIWDTNEAFYVETPRQMVQSGDYINPSFNGNPRFNKPVLSYWIVAGLYRAFGESVTVERVGIAVGAMGIVLAAFLIGRALRSTITGVVAALVVSTAPRVVWFSRRIFIDVYLTVFTSLALACFVLAERHPVYRRRYLWLMYVALGLGVLTKGPVALVLPALVCLTWLILEHRLRDLQRLMILPGLLVVLAIVLPWYLAVYWQHGWTYITNFLVTENLERFGTTAMTPGARGPLFFVPVLFSDLFPWAPLVIVPLMAIVAAWRRPKTDEYHAQSPVSRLLWLWIVVFVGVFSFSRTKEDLYIFPIVPAVAALVASALCESFAKTPSRVLSAAFLGVSGLCLVAAPGLSWLFGPTAGYYVLPEIREFSWVLGVTGVVALALWACARRLEAVASLGAGFIVLNYVFVGCVLPGVERTKPVPPLAHVVATQASPDAKIGYFNMGLQSFVYYTNRRAIEEIGMLDQAKAFFFDRRDAWALMGESDWRALQPLVPGVCVAARHRLSIFDAKLEAIVSRTPPLEVFLIKNHCDNSR